MEEYEVTEYTFIGNEPIVVRKEKVDVHEKERNIEIGRAASIIIRKAKFFTRKLFD